MADTILDEILKEDGAQLVDPLKPLSTEKTVDVSLGKGEAGSEEAGKKDGGEDGSGGDVINERVKFFNDTFGTSYKDEAEIDFKTLREKASRFSEFETKATELEKFKSDYEALKSQMEEVSKSVDPRQWFANEGEFKKQVFLKKYPDYDPVVIGKLAVMEAEQISKLSPTEVLVMEKKLEDSDIYRNEQEILEALEGEFGASLDGDFNELSSLERNKILKAAKAARQKFLNIKGDVKLPDEFNPEAVKAKKDALVSQLTTEWSPFIKDELKGKISKIQYKFKTEDGKEEVFDFDVDESFVNDVVSKPDAIVKHLAESGQGFSAESKEALVNSIRILYEQNHRGKIMQAYANHKTSELQKQIDEMIKNPASLDRSRESSEKGKTDAERKREEADRALEEDLGIK